jgi:hypothetical protein
MIYPAEVHLRIIERRAQGVTQLFNERSAVDDEWADAGLPGGNMIL